MILMILILQIILHMILIWNHLENIDFDFDFKSLLERWVWFWFQIILETILPNTGCGRHRAASVKSQAVQRTEKCVILFMLCYLSEQYRGKVSSKVSSFFQDGFKMYPLKGIVQTLLYSLVSLHVSLCRQLTFQLPHLQSVMSSQLQAEYSVT